jgi:arginyl-tRNA synthetase
MMDEEDEIST